MKREITMIRFAEAIHIGKSLDVNSSLSKGQTIVGVPIELAFDGDHFISVTFKGKTKEEKYVQLIPIAAVATILFNEVK